MAATVSNGPTTEEEKTIVAPECLIKHPLNRRWTLWYLIADKTKNWNDAQFQVATVDSVEDFWALYNHIEPASQLKLGSDYSLFREGVRPAWEDDANREGGKWCVQMPKNFRHSQLDFVWMEIMMLLVGECNEEDVHNEITGAVVSVRRNCDRVAVWTAHAHNQELTMKTGRTIKHSLNWPFDPSLEYTLHSDSSNKKSSSVRAAYTV